MSDLRSRERIGGGRSVFLPPQPWRSGIGQNPPTLSVFEFSATNLEKDSRSLEKLKRNLCLVHERSQKWLRREAHVGVDLSLLPFESVGWERAERHETFAHVQ